MTPGSTLPDDRHAIVLVVVDDLGDRPVSALGGRTPAEAASTPVLDELANRGASGLHLPFGWGRAALPDVTHWSMLGFGEVPYCGRAVLEALGAGHEVAEDTPVVLAGLRCSDERDGGVWVTGRAAAGDGDDCDELLAALNGLKFDGVVFNLSPLGEGEAVLTLDGASGEGFTDTDPMFPGRHPFLRPVPLDEEAQPAAFSLEEFLAAAQRILAGHPCNLRRAAGGLPALDLLTTWGAGRRRRLPTFAARVGCAGAAVTGGRADRGRATLLGMSFAHATALPDAGADIGYRIALAGKLLERGAAFVEIHTTALVGPSRDKDPQAKRDAIESLDRGLAHLPALAERAVVAVVADGAGPSSGGLIRSGDPAPMVVAGPTVRPDAVAAFGEAPAAAGAFGVLRAADILPVLLGYANRPGLLGSQIAAPDTVGFPDDPAAFPAGFSQPG